MANYTKTTDFAAKDTLPGGDTNKVVRGTEFETEFDAISTAIATKSDTAGPTFTGTVTIPTVDINAGAIDGTTIGANSAAAGTFTNLTATTADINGGTVDGATIGGSSAGAGTFTNLTASGTVNFSGATISNLGTITTANLDGGTADNMVIGGSTAAAGTFTTLAATSATVGGSAVLTSVAFSDIDAGAVTLSSQTFSDVDNQIPTNAAVIDYVAATIPLISEVNDLSANVTWANVPDANITQSSVTQHQAALAIAATQITSLTSTVAELNILDGVTATTAELNYVDGVTSNIQTQIDSINPSPSFTATASGSIANGKPCIIKADGNVAQVGFTASDPPTKGTAAEFESGAIGSFAASVYDPDTNRIIVAYNDAGDSDKGKAAVGTVSGTGISFGTPVEFEAGSTSVQGITYDTNANRVVITYIDYGNSSYGTSIVGTVSGTSISFGTAVVYNSGESTEQAITFDSSNNKVVICYRDNANSNHGTAIVGTVSGTSISFGSEVSYNSANSTNNTATFDSSNNKVVIAYRDGGNSNYGTAIVGTVSGTSISFGSEVVFSGSSAVQFTSAVFDSSNDKVVIAYRDDGNSAYGTAIVGTVSGTSISFGTAVVFASSTTVYTKAAFDSGLNQIGIVWRDGSDADALDFRVGTVSGTSISFGTSIELAGDVEQSPIAYDSSSGQFVVAYHDDGDSSKGKAVVVTTSATNLTTENYVGIADAAYSDTNTATIQTIGAVDDAQSGLTAGQLYYVQGGGTLSTTAGTPSVVAGVAISSTKLLVSRS